MLEKQPGAWVRLIDKVYLLHEISLSRLRELTVSSNAHKPAQTVKENEETRDYISTKELDKSPEINLN